MKYSPYQRRLFEQAFRNLAAGIDGTVEPEQVQPLAPALDAHSPSTAPAAEAVAVAQAEPVAPAIAEDVTKGGGEFSLGALADGMRSFWGKRRRPAEADDLDGVTESVRASEAEADDSGVEAERLVPAAMPEPAQAQPLAIAEFVAAPVRDATENPVFGQQAQHYFASLSWQSGTESQRQQASDEQAIEAPLATMEATIAPVRAFPDAAAASFFMGLPWQEVAAPTAAKLAAEETEPVAAVEALLPTPAVASRPDAFGRSTTLLSLPGSKLRSLRQQLQPMRSMRDTCRGRAKQRWPVRILRSSAGLASFPPTLPCRRSRLRNQCGNSC